MQTIKLEGVEETIRKLSHIPRVLEKAEVSAINKLAAQGMTQASKSIREKYNIKAKDLKPHLKLRKARFDQLFAIITASGRSIPLYKFGATPKSPVSQKGIPVRKRRPATVKVRKSGSRKTVQHAFVAQMKSGHIGIFKRKRSGRQSNSIKERYSLGVPAMFRLAGKKRTVTLIHEKAPEILRREIDFYLAKELKKGRG